MNVLNTPKENHKFNTDILNTEYINLEKLKESFEPLPEDLEHNYNPFHIQKLQKYNRIINIISMILNILMIFIQNKYTTRIPLSNILLYWTLSVT